MSCLELPTIDFPALQAPFRIDPPELSIDVDVTLCCKLVTWSPKIPVPFPPQTINPAVLATVKAAAQAVRTFLSARPLTCPRELE